MNKTSPAQENLQLSKSIGDTTYVEKYEFEPIKGYPMLNWRGKRPITSTQYYPAQLKEIHGEEVDGWRNKIFWGDNLQVMSHLLKEFRGKVDLIYIDPPFDSKADYKKRVSLKGKSVFSELGAFEEKQYGDIWSNDEYLQFIYERLMLIKELLTPDGSIFLHCDWHKMHYLRCILDEVFGADGFVDEIVWKSQSPSGMKANANQFSYCHETIFWYAKSSSRIFNKQYFPYSDEYIKKRFTGKDERGSYKDYELQDPSKETLEKLKQDNRLIITSGGKYRVKQYLDEAPGVLVDTVWLDISAVNSQASDRTDYPTQKPEKLLERIICAATNPNDLVFDCFMGSGTTQVAALKQGRRFIGADINLGAIQTTAKRLIRVAEELRQKPLDSGTKYFTGCEVYNVNHYDIFRNPVQAKDLLIEALEVQKLEFSSVFDGEKDGRMVKIMPVNRITTRADLSELIAGFNYKAWERKQNDSPNRPVEKVTLICMGHEPDLAAQLEMVAKPFKIDVEVVDILRDKADLEFKRDSQAKVTIKNGELVIEKFYPMNLLQKFSLQTELVEDWRELVESVLIDWNYDGAVLQPSVLDIPSKNDMVKGAYKVPGDAGTIRVKITDLISESWEGELING